MKRILQLSSVVANQIAAGEVIERPASLVKELLENSLDASASSIDIEISFGGLNQIKIADNGSGILADDLPLAISAHATSKISQLDDLSTISTMGFRGEALSSIAAVSKFSLISKPAIQEHAMMLQVNGSGEFSISPTARKDGTTVEVRDLFFNAPVRKKFLKSARSEFQAIEMVVKRFALSAPSIAITLTNDGKQVFTLPASICEKTKLLRIRKLLGKSFIDNAAFIDVDHAGMRLTGWVSGKEYQPSQNDKVWVYINQRMVKDKLINHAIKKAYEGFLHAGRYPACLIYLSISPIEVDVNVHPTKHEVRFQQPRLVHDFISSTIIKAYEQFKEPVIDDYSSNYLLPMVNHKSEREDTSIKQSFSVQESVFDENISCFMLNANFGIVDLSEGPYLVNLAKVQSYWLLTILNKQQLPLSSRPLLVPIVHNIEKNNCKLIEQYQSILLNFGIQLDWVGEFSIVVRTIPVILPNLDIKKFFNKIYDVEVSEENLKKLLVSCQSFDARQLEDRDKLLLSNYIKDNLEPSHLLSKFCLRLSMEKCQELFKVRANV